MSYLKIGARHAKAFLCGSLVSILILVSSLAAAEEPKRLKALFFTFEDAQLEWGPCPKFFPDGCEIAILQGNPAEENADIFFKVPPKSVLPRHWHTSAERMVLLSGELHLTFDGQETAVLSPGTYAYGPAKLPHKGFCAAGDPCVLFIAFEQPVDAVPIENMFK
jgi:quercetin dioxygenase-like cupin family protein